jgi:hypothetical protein
MLRKLLVFILLLAIVGGVVFWFISAPQTLAANALSAPHTANVKNGETMFFAGGCSSCHAQPGQDNKYKLTGGLALKSPFGTFYAPNISPDPNDGIGKWSEVDFYKAMKYGVSPGFGGSTGWTGGASPCDPTTSGSEVRGTSVQATRVSAAAAADTTTRMRCFIRRPRRHRGATAAAVTR